MKIAISENFIKMLKGKIEIVSERRAIFNINDKLQFLNESNTTKSPDKPTIKRKQNIKPKCQTKWEE